MESVTLQPSLHTYPFVSVLCCVSPFQSPTFFYQQWWIGVLKTAHFVLARLWQIALNGLLLYPVLHVMWNPLICSIHLDQHRWFWIVHFTFTDGESDKISEVICGDERVHSWGQFRAPRQSEVSPQVRHPVCSLDVKCLLSLTSFNVCVRVCVRRQMDKLQQENLELVRRLAAQEEALSYSNRQLDQRSSECQALSRQLEAALSDVRQQVQLRVWSDQWKRLVVKA